LARNPQGTLKRGKPRATCRRARLRWNQMEELHEGAVFHIGTRAKNE